MTSSQKEESIPTGKSVEAYRRFLNMKNREYRVLVTLALMASLVVGNIAGTSVNVQAADNKDKSTETKKTSETKTSSSATPAKDETVYVKVDDAGNQKDVTVSDQLKNISSLGTIDDVSDLKDIKNVKGDETFSENNGKLAFYYIENGMGKSWKWLAKIFAFMGVCVGLFGIGTFTQINGITSAVHNFFDANNAHTVQLFGMDYSWSVVISGILLTICVALVVIGGLKRISTVAQVIVPFMAVTYVVACLLVLIFNVTAIPAAIVTIVQSAFGMRAVAGGALGAVIMAMQKGIARGIFSNEAGIGSAPIAAAAAQNDSPAKQGLISMMGTIIDTLIICTMTGLTIVITDSWNVGLDGVDVTTRAFQQGLPFNSSIASFILMVCLVFFAFTTILGWDYYSERCLEYLIGQKPKAIKVYRWIYIACVFIGPYMTVKAVWTIADIFNGLMAIPNLIALLALNGVVVAETKKYLDNAKKKF